MPGNAATETRHTATATPKQQDDNVLDTMVAGSQVTMTLVAWGPLGGQNSLETFVRTAATESFAQAFSALEKHVHLTQGNFKRVFGF